MTRQFIAGLVIAVGGCAAPGRVPPPPAAPAAASGEISAAELKADLEAFAADSMRGRETGTEDATRAATFLADRIQRLGLEPAGDSLYVQRIPLQRERFTRESRLIVAEGSRTTALEIGRDLIPLVNLGAGVPPARRDADAGLVFAGYGLTITKPSRDDFAGLSLEGKVVVVINGAPAGVDSATRARLESQTAVSERLARILPARPAAVIILFVGNAASELERSTRELLSAVSQRSSTGDVPESERVLPMIMLGTARAGSPLLPSAWPRDDRAQVLDGKSFSGHVRQERSLFTALNVVGVVRGSDPTLSRTFVALGAHYDHIGIVAPVNGDSIANGADDDGSGSVALLAIARSLQQEHRPKRSTLLVWHVGEEKGLLGSQWFVDHATVPIDSVVAQVNADMIGRNDPSLLYIIGPNAAPGGQSKRLGAIVDSVNAAQVAPFRINREWDSATHPEHLYQRSDHFNYARKGIPVVFLTTGLHDDYHRPGDEAQKIDYEKLARVTRLVRDAVIAVGNAPKRPR